MGRLLEELWYRRREGWLARVLLWPLWLGSLLFGAIVGARITRARRTARKVDAKVISVGNLVVGGAGKTPTAIHLAQRLIAKGERPFVLSRGYGRDQPHRAVVVSDGKGAIYATARQAGDEPLLIARACPGAGVIVSIDRRAAAEVAIEDFGARLFLLDDGLQHLGLARDLDVVVLDASNPFGNGHLLPRGPMREPKRGLSRAGVLWLSKVEQAAGDEIAALESDVRRYSQAPIVKSAYRVADVLDDSGRSLGVDALKGKKVMLFAGLARPESFRRTLEAMGAIIAAERRFPDHHWFHSKEIEEAKLMAQRQGCEWIAMTEKDAVRLPESEGKGPFAAVRIDVEIREGEPALVAALG